MSAPDPVLVAQRLSKDYWVDDPERGRVKARVVEDASIALVPGAIHALVGESGSGKSTLARMLGFVVRPSAGRIVLGGAVQRRKTPSRAMLRRVQILFQDPYGSLNPLQRLRYILGRPLRLHGYARTRRDVDAGVNEVLESVSLSPAADFIDRRPAELSGGQRQRVVIARALATRPDVILADEPVSMLDVSIRLEILHLLKRLSADQEVAMLFVTHDIASARYVAQSISVMYAGRIVEAGPIADVIDRPLHPYTRLLVESTPDAPAPGERRAARALLRRVDAGEPPTVTQRPQGCRFQPRCPAATDICAQQQPPTVEIAAQRAECWHPLRPVTQSHPSDTAGSERA